MKTNRELFNQVLATGIRKGWWSFVWVLKILLPITFIISLLEWSGWIHKVDFIFQPLMNWLNLPPLAALPLIFGILSGIYGGIAAMVVLPFTKDQMTLMAIFMMIAHSLPQEGMIQGKSGLHPFKATVIRIGAAVLTVMIIAPFFETAPVNLPAMVSVPLPHHSFGTFLESWFLANMYLSLKIFGIILSLFVFLEMFKALGWVWTIIKMASPFLKIFGLSSKAGIMWLTGTIFGVIYGAAIIVEEIKEGLLSKEELERLHLSIGIQHSIIEDPILFMALGLNAFWLWIPRLLVAIFVVRLYGLWQFFRK